MKTYSCPKCGHDVPLDKINVAKDIMLCPSCGEASCFSDLVGAFGAKVVDAAKRPSDGQ